MKKFLFAIFLIFQLIFPLVSSAQDTLVNTSHQLKRKRIALVLGSELALYGGLMYGLNELWYKDFPKSSFHTFNDSREWLQMDKIGHATTAYYVGRLGMRVMDWTGMKRNNAVILGGSLGSIFLTSIEIYDGYSSAWGFSYSDMLANAFGSCLAIGEELAWKEQRISLKFSFSPSPYSTYRPSVLGKNYQESLLKDYNGQTYWLSTNIASFLSNESAFPKWLNLAIGYGADGMIGAELNPITDSSGNLIGPFKRTRQYYLSFDLEMSKLPIKNKFLKTLFTGIGFIKFPAPALEFNESGSLKFKPFFF